MVWQGKSTKQGLAGTARNFLPSGDPKLKKKKKVGWRRGGNLKRLEKRKRSKGKGGKKEVFSGAEQFSRGGNENHGKGNQKNEVKESKKRCFPKSSARKEVVKKRGPEIGRRLQA